MTPESTIIRECSVCGRQIAEYTIGSGNTFGARFWTDGKRDAPMLPDHPWLVKCPHCSTLIWIDEQKQIGQVDHLRNYGQAANEFEYARPATEPTFSEYISLLASGVETGEKEKYVRLRAWWAGNDARRNGDQVKPLTEMETANLRAFAVLLNEKDDNDRLVKAEVLRELRMFVEAERLLARQFEKGLMQAAVIIRKLNRDRETGIAEMMLDSRP